jgi:hypothetical protein
VEVSDVCCRHRPLLLEFDSGDILLLMLHSFFHLLLLLLVVECCSVGDILVGALFCRTGWPVMFYIYYIDLLVQAFYSVTPVVQWWLLRRIRWPMIHTFVTFR